MARASNVIVTFFNMVFIIFALIAIGSSIWFQLHSGTNCEKVLQKPLLILGCALLALSILGLIGAWYQLKFFLWMYLLVLFLLIVGLIGFTVFTIMITNKSVGDAISNKGIDQAKTGDYSHWLQKHVVDPENWNKIKSCFVGMELCKDKGEKIYKRTQLGCCQPPSYCGFESKNLTTWIKPKKGLPKETEDNVDCKTWSNVQTELCYECHSCKAAVLSNIKREWKLLTLTNIIVFIIILFIYSVGCCALRNNVSSEYNKHW